MFLILIDLYFDCFCDIYQMFLNQIKKVHGRDLSNAVQKFNTSEKSAKFKRRSNGAFLIRGNLNRGGYDLNGDQTFPRKPHRRFAHKSDPQALSQLFEKLSTSSYVI